MHKTSPTTQNRADRAMHFFEPLLCTFYLTNTPQSRKRYYWTNILNITQPNNKGIMLKDILENNDIPVDTIKGKSHTFLASYSKVGQNLFPSYNAERTRQKIAVPISIGSYGSGGQGQRIYSVHGKSVTLSANGGGMGAKTGLYKIDLPDGNYVIRKLTPVEAERLQTLPDNYTEGISDTQRYKCIGNGWTVDVIAHILGELAA